jgi:hypothetical protein
LTIARGTTKILRVDPVTLVVTAVALGASAGLTDTATTAVKDAYAALKRLLGSRSVDVSGVERRPESAAQRTALQEDLADAAAPVDDELLAAARAVTDAVAAHDAGAAQAIGVDLNDVEAAFIKIGTVTSTGTGVRIDGARISGGITVDDVRAGGSPDPSAR